MTTSDNNFFHKQRVDVYVCIDGHTAQGTLQFGGFAIPIFNLKKYDPKFISTFFTYIKNKKYLTCTSLSGEITFTLYSIKIHELAVSADYLTIGKQLPSFDTFKLHMTGLSTWIEENRYFSSSEDYIERSINTDIISESFTFNSNKYSLSINYYSNTNNYRPEENDVSIKHSLVIRKLQGDFSLEECKNITHELRNLFSLLIGNSLSVTEIWVSNQDNPAISQWLFFPTVLYEQEPLQDARDALIPFGDMIQGNKLSTILSEFFTKDPFRNIWNRLVLSFREMGVWEYDILARVVTLEMYASVKTKGKTLRLSESLKIKFKQCLKNAIDQFEISQTFSQDNKLVFEGMKRSILETRNTSLPTLREKYEELLLELSPSLRKIISFTTDDFNIIKEVRDCTAHGREYNRRGFRDDITHEMQLSNRFLVLLMCYVYIELGFSEKEIITSLKISHCRFIRWANLDHCELDRLSGLAVFIKLNNPPENITLHNYEMVVVNHSYQEDSWFVNEKITQKLCREWQKSGIPCLLDYVKSKIPAPENHTFEMLQHAYIESEENETEHFSLVVIHS